MPPEPSAPAIEVIVNGSPTSIPERCTVRQLLTILKLDTMPAAVERNKLVIPRRAHESTTLNAGDRIEIVTLVGGG